MQDAVEDSGGDGDVSKDLVPLGECFVRGEDGRGLFIASGNELKEEIGSLNIHGKVTDLVILYLARIFSLSGRRFSKWAFLSCSMS